MHTRRQSPGRTARTVPGGLLFLLAASVLLAGLLLSGCSAKKPAATTLKIAEQYGLAYAPVQLLRVEKVLEKEGIKTEWVRLMNTAAIREAMLAGKVDIGFMGIPPFLIGRDRGMDWKIFTGLCRAPLGLVTLRSDIHGLKDLGPHDRIALPQPGSIQHILLSMAAKKRFGRADYFDNQLVTLSHPDGLSALAAGGDITAHYTSPPYLFEELKLPGASLLTDGTHAFGGPFTFIVGVTTAEFAENRGELLQTFVTALDRAVAETADSPVQTAERLAGEYGIPAETLTGYLENRDLHFETGVLGLSRFQEFMSSVKLLRSPPAPDTEILVQPALGPGEDP